MEIIQKNPYRIVGLLVGATAREQERQVNRLKQFIEAEQDPQDDFSFPTLGNLHRTLDKINEAASKLNLDSDKMSAALFWFYDGKKTLKTDEDAFKAIKEADLDQVITIWTKLTSKGVVTQQNASAYSNLGTLYLSGIFEGTNTNEVILEQGISLKLKFLESSFYKELQHLATDEKTYKPTKQDLQLLLLNQLQSDVEKSGTVTLNKFLDILIKQDFSAKEDFLKGFVQKLIETIEHQIETTKNKRKYSKADASIAGQELIRNSAHILIQLKNIVGTNDLKYTSISDKVANEVLQCSIDFFNDSQEKNSSSNLAETAMKLAKQAETLAFSKITKERVYDSIETLAQMVDRELFQAIDLLKSIKEAFESNEKKIREQVREQEALLSINQSINRVKVNLMITNSLNWSKVTELIQEVIPRKNIEKIKNANNKTKLNEYIALVNFIMNKISYLYKDRVSYICYWEMPRITSPTTPAPPEFNFKDNAWWILGVLGALIGLLVYSGWGSAIGALAGLIITGVIHRPWVLIFPILGAIIGLYWGGEGAGIGALFGGLIAIRALLLND